ncbi:WxL domain-containing protein [Bacillus cereus]|nr:WxL domain-containing protein [Bacillus cereus]
MKLVKLGTTSALALATFASTSVSAFAALETEGYSREYKSNAVVEFLPDDGTTGPIDPENPDPNNPVDPWDPSTPKHEPSPGSDGPLSLDYVSSLEFGKNKITNKDEVYYANPQYLWNEDHTDVDLTTARPNFVQVSDKRGTNAGWSLTVKQEGQLKNENTKNKELTGAEITFAQSTPVSNIENVTAPKVMDFTLDPNGASSKVMVASNGSGAGTWVDRFGSAEKVTIDGEQVLKNKAITLSVPGKTPKDAAKYETKLTWTLTDAPGNNE